MYKKLVMACMAVATFTAFAFPATTSAVSPALTDASGNIVPAGTSLKGTAIGSTFFRGSWGEVTCATATLIGELKKNNDNGEAIEGTITSVSFFGTATEHKSAHCRSGLGSVTVTTNVGNGTPWCVKALGGEAMELQIRGNGCTSAARSITYRLDFTEAGIECNYERSLAGPIKGTYNTAPEDAKGTIKTGANSEFKVEAGQSIFCPTSGSLEMQFELTTSTGGTLSIH